MYPVTLELDRPPKIGRPQVLLRIAILILASWIAGSGGWLGLIALGLPVVAAILISQKGGARYLTEDGDRVTGWVTFIVGVLAYVGLLTEELPGGGRKPIRLNVVRSGTPTVGSALLRIVLAIPSAIVIAVIGIAGWVVWVVAAISILVNETYPESLWNFQCGVVRWEARLLVYLASLVEEYPPFAFDTGAVGVPA